MTMTRSQFTSLMTEGLREVFFMQYKDKDPVWPKIFEVRSSRQKTETDQSIAGIGMPTEKAEGVGITYADYVEGYETNYTHTSYGKGLRFTRELVDDDLYGIMKNRTKALARVCNYRKEYDAASLFNNAFGTSIFTGGDAKALCASDHPEANNLGATQSNTVSSDLSLAALETAMIAFRDIKDDTGLLVSYKPSILLVPNELEFDAYEIVNSTQKPYTTDNDANYWKGKLQVVVWDQLTDSDAWFLLSAKSDGAPIWYNRVPIEYKADGDFDTYDVKTAAYMRYSFGFSDWRWCYGSQGA